MQPSVHRPVIVHTHFAAKLALMRKFHGILLAAMLFMFLFPAVVLAQFENGSIVGTVHDGTGAVVSGATVTVTNVGTGVVSTRTTNDSGDYEVPALRVGQYNVVITHAGFSLANATDITVSVASRQRIDLNIRGIREIGRAHV